MLNAKPDSVGVVPVTVSLVVEVAVESTFATQLRSQYRKWLYGLRYDEDIDIGENPIKVLEAIQFFDFLKQPVIYLNHEPIPVS